MPTSPGPQGRPAALAQELTAPLCRRSSRAVIVPRRHFRKRRPCSEPIQGPRLVRAALVRLGLLPQVRSQMALLAFSLCCGPRLHGHARAERLAHGILYVRVQSSAWASEISFVQAELLAKIRAFPGGRGVRALRFTIGPVLALPPWVDAPPADPSPPVPLSPDPQVIAALGQVRSAELRQALGALYVAACLGGRTS